MSPKLLLWGRQCQARTLLVARNLLSTPVSTIRYRLCRIIQPQKIEMIKFSNLLQSVNVQVSRTTLPRASDGLQGDLENRDGEGWADKLNFIHIQGSTLPYIQSRQKIANNVPWGRIDSKCLRSIHGNHIIRTRNLMGPKFFNRILPIVCLKTI